VKGARILQKWLPGAYLSQKRSEVEFDRVEVAAG